MEIRRDTHDVSWTDANIAAVLLLCVLALAGCFWNLSMPAFVMTDRIPVDPIRHVQASQKVNPNTASSASLQRLPGIGPTRAQAIIEFRSSRPAPAFRSDTDLQPIHGIGQGVVRQISPFLIFED